jgi:hypothetical protein
VPVVEQGFDPLWVVLAAALVGGVVARAIECFRHNNNQTAAVFVSPN